MLKVEKLEGSGLLHFESFNKFLSKSADDYMVTAIAADTLKDTQRDRFTKECLELMSKEFMDDDMGRNMREGHDPTRAVGNAFHSQIHKDAEVHKWVLISEVTDPVTWHKIKKNTLKGLSVGGEVLECYYENKGLADQTRVITKARINEVSYVDRPAQPGALVLLYKRYQPGDLPDKEGATMTKEKPKDTEEAPSLVAGDAVFDHIDNLLKGSTAVADPATILDDMSVHHTNLIKAGKTDEAQLASHSMILFQQATDDAGDVDPDEVDEKSDEGGADGVMGGKSEGTGSLRKVGKAINQKRQDILYKSAMTILNELATSGHPDACRMINGRDESTTGHAVSAKSEEIGNLSKSMSDSQAGLIRALEKVAEVVGKQTYDVGIVKSIVMSLPDRSRAPKRFESAGKELPSNEPLVKTAINPVDRVNELHKLQSASTNALEKMSYGESILAAYLGK